MLVGSGPLRGKKMVWEGLGRSAGAVIEWEGYWLWEGSGRLDFVVV